MSISIILSNNQKIYGLTPEQTSLIKDSLTFDNPKYAQAKRYGRSRYISIPPYLTYYTENRADKCLEVPIGVNVLDILKLTNNYSTKELFNEEKVTYPKIKIDLRDDQNKALHGFHMFNRPHIITNHTGVIQLPTGKGKSILGIYMSYYLNCKTLILVHKDDLVVGWKKDIEMCFGGKVKCGLIKAKKREVGNQFTIATVQTLSKMSDEELIQYTNQFSMVIQDEVHHVGANTFNLVDKFNAYYKIGLSATPTRTDGLNFVFDIFFGGIVYKHKYDTSDKDISKVEVKLCNSKVKFKPFCPYRGDLFVPEPFNYYDYKKEELPKRYVFLEDLPFDERPRVMFLETDKLIVTNRMFKIRVCKDIMSEYKQGHSCLALFTQKEHIDAYYNYLKRYIPESKIMKYYGDSKEKSEDMMKKAESREVLVTLGTLAKTTEGTNVKAWEVLFLVSSINNRKNVEQAVGRIRRTAKGKIDPVIVYDYAHPEVYGTRSHRNTRLGVYKDLKFSLNYVDGESPKKSNRSMFSRGYN